MAKKIIKAQMKQRRDTLENWAAANPVLLDGELGFIEGFNDRFKVGDGKTAWNDLSYFSGSFDPSGTYPDLTAGDLAGRGESVPASFGFRASGGKSIKDGRAYIKRIKGNSVVWNNMVDTRGYEGEFVIRDGVTIIAGHKYLLMREKADGYLYLNPIVDGAEKYDMVLTPAEYAKIFVAQYTDTTDSRAYGTTNMGGCIVSDLTKMFGAGNEPTTIEEFNARVATLGIDMNAYNEGQVIHCNTESIKSVGDNAWDKQWESGHIDYHTGVNTPDSGRLRTKGYIRVLPNEEYHLSLPTASYPSDLVVICYDENKAFVQHIGGGSANKTFRIPTNCHYIRFTWDGTQYANNIMLSLVHSGWKQDTDAGYQPYWQDTLPLPIINKYFPDGMKKAGSAHDEIRFNKASGKWEYSKGKIKSVDMGDMTWGYNNSAGNERLFTLSLADVMQVPNTVTKGCLLTTLYSVASFNDIFSHSSDRLIGLHPNGQLIVYDSAYTDAASFKADMQGVILYYESKDWEWVELDAEDQHFRDYYQVADFGTEMSQSDVSSAAFSADIIYQFNAVDMIREHEMEINELQSIIATMQAQLTSLINK